MTLTMKARLSAMMFLEYFIWGAWYVTLSTWLASDLHLAGRQIGLAAGATAVGAMIAPFAVGLIADKLFSTQHVLAALHAAGAVLLFFVSRQTTFASLYGVVLLYCIAFMPTLALTNSLAFRQMRDAKLEFGPIRVLGTLGWIIAGLIVGALAWEKTHYPVLLASAASLVMAVYCLTLPATPPLARDAQFTLATIFPPEAFALLRERSMAVFAIASLLICIPLQFYYAFTNLFLNESGVTNAAGKMTGGQFSELFCMLLIPWFFRRLGVKYMLVAGMLAWTARYILFAYGDPGSRVWMLWGGILLHGICYDFFFVTGQIYIDRKAPLALRGAAQGLITFITYGAGMFIGSWLSGAVVEHFTYAPASIAAGTSVAAGPSATASAAIPLLHNWQAIWIVSATASALVLIFFLLTFQDSEPQPAPSGTQETLATPVPVELPL